MFELHTQRLILRDLVDSDWPVIYAMSQATAVTRYQSWLRLSSEAEARHWVAQAMHSNADQPRSAYNLAIVQKASNIPVGWFGWGPPSEPEHSDYDCSFGYALLPTAWGHGYMTEALRAGIATMFELGADRISGECAKSNRASARVMQKAGMQLIAEWEEHDVALGISELQQRYLLQRGSTREATML